MRRIATALLGTYVLLAVTVMAQAPVRPDQVEIQGTRIAQAEAAGTDPVVLVGKRGVVAVLANGLDAYCAARTAAVEHSLDGGYRLDEDVLEIPGLVEAVRLRGDALRCLRIVGDRPARSDVARLEADLVEAMGLTVLLPPGN